MQPKQITGSDTFHLELNEGMDYLFSFVYVDESTLLPVDLTGYQAELYVRMNPGSAQVVKGISTSYSYLDGSIALGSAGQVSVSVSGSFTTGLTWDNGFYDLVLTNPDQRRVKLLKGRVNVYNTMAFPAVYSPSAFPGALELTSGKTTMPNGIDLFGYMNPLKMGIGGGLLFTGGLRPAFYMDHEIVELSFSGVSLRLTFAGNVPVENLLSMRIGSSIFTAASSGGRVFNGTAVGGLGLTFWEWRDVGNPFGDVEGWVTSVALTPVPI